MSPVVSPLFRPSPSSSGPPLLQVLVLLSGGASGIGHVLSGNAGSVVNGGTDPISEGWFGFVAHVMLPQRGATFSYVHTRAVSVRSKVQASWGWDGMGICIQNVTPQA